MLPIIRTFISLPAGVARMPFWRFSVLTFLGCLPWVFMLTFIGKQAGDNWEDWKDSLHYFDYAVAARDRHRRGLPGHQEPAQPRAAASGRARRRCGFAELFAARRCSTGRRSCCPISSSAHVAPALLGATSTPSERKELEVARPRRARSLALGLARGRRAVARRAPPLPAPRSRARCSSGAIESGSARRDDGRRPGRRRRSRWRSPTRRGRDAALATGGRRLRPVAGLRCSALAQARALVPGVSRHGATLDRAAGARASTGAAAHALSREARKPVLAGAVALKGWRVAPAPGAGRAARGRRRGSASSTCRRGAALRVVGAPPLWPFAALPRRAGR